MGLFIIAGLLIVFGILFWALEENYNELWMLVAKIICLTVGCAMLFVLLLMMGTNRADEAVVNMEKKLCYVYARARRL